MRCDLLLAICSGAKYTGCVYVECGTDILCNLRGSLHTFSDLPRVEEDAANGRRHELLRSSTGLFRLGPLSQISQLGQRFVSVSVRSLW